MAIQSKSAPIGPWGKATAGATGAVLANALVYPLDMCAHRNLVSSFFFLSFFYRQTKNKLTAPSRIASRPVFKSKKSASPVKPPTPLHHITPQHGMR